VAGTTEYGVGNLSGAWGILVPGQTANLAYLVFREDDIPTLQIKVKAATPTGTPILTTSGSDTLMFPDPWPEPATCSLLALALATLSAIRRRFN
jgi:hypothetical protein